MNKKYIGLKLLIDIIIAGSIVGLLYVYMYQIPHKLKEEQHVSITNTNDWSFKFKNKFSQKIISTSSVYKSPDISVEITKNFFGEDNDKVTYFVADVYIANIKLLQTHFAKNTYGVGYKDGLKDMSQEMMSIFAMNGDSYNSNEHGNSGTIIRNGIVYRKNQTVFDVCVLYHDGTMKVFSPEDFDPNRVIEEGAYQTWIFGPSLLDENGNIPSQYNHSEYINKNHPRSAIGYYEPGHYAFVLVDGRQNGYSRGMTLEELSKVFAELGCKCAYNLDGGHCSFMTMGENIVNHPFEMSKDLSDGIFIGEYDE